MRLDGEINAKVPLETRTAIENYAKRERLSLGAATRHFLSIGIENHKAAIA
jgi:hypothetical protein